MGGRERRRAEVLRGQACVSFSLGPAVPDAGRREQGAWAQAGRTASRLLLAATQPKAGDSTSWRPERLPTTS